MKFRNYEGLQLDLTPGMTLVEGENGQGKSNLLEAVYMLAIGKSARASNDRELVLVTPGGEESYSQVSAVVQRDDDQLRAQIDFRTTPAVFEDGGERADRSEAVPPEAVTVQKYIRLNGVPRRASDLVGQVNAVIFSPEDMELVPGPPTVRRRYLDILMSQLDRRYLQALRRYNRVVAQRNHLLRQVREGSSTADQLAFWDGELVKEGAYIMTQRSSAVRKLSDLARPTHHLLSGGRDDLEILYRPSVQVGAADGETPAAGFQRVLETQRAQEIARGVTVSGPHRDDLKLMLGGADAGVYASRGQTRTIVLAMKMAEARYLLEQGRQRPILLLDDVLSELDPRRRAHVLEQAALYEQCILTTADPGTIDAGSLSQMSRFVVKSGTVEPAPVSTS